MFVVTTLTAASRGNGSEAAARGCISSLEKVCQTVFSPRVTLSVVHLVLSPGLACEAHIDPAGFGRRQEELP